MAMVAMVAARPADRLAAAGQGVVEYGLILGGSALLAVLLLLVFGGTVSGFLKVVGDLIDSAS